MLIGKDSVLHTARKENALEGAIEHPAARSKSDAISHPELLIREMQHRIANSLQIVAGILSLKARTVKSDDARLHLLDAYARVMSVAAVQRQLLDSKQQGMIRVGDYLSELGERLAKSLTEDVRLSVIADNSPVMKSNEAVAMGLIVTELVINALRHAFPKERRGTIIIRFKTFGSGWKLSVSDDGIGLSNPPAKNTSTGHGSKIIDALAKELDACIAVTSASKGTCVSLVHSNHGSDHKHACGSLMR